MYRELEQHVDIEMIRQFIKSEEIANAFMRYEKQCRIGMSVEEMDEILSGMGFEKNCQKAKSLTYYQQWNLAEYLCERLSAKGSTQEIGINKYKEMSGWIDNVLEFLVEVDEKGVLSEKAFYYINRSEKLLKAVTVVKTKQYLMLCDRFLGSVKE